MYTRTAVRGEGCRRKGRGLSQDRGYPHPVNSQRGRARNCCTTCRRHRPTLSTPVMQQKGSQQRVSTSLL